mgnify:CR=1 FL=1
METVQELRTVCGGIDGDVVAYSEAAGMSAAR